MKHVIKVISIFVLGMLSAPLSHSHVVSSQPLGDVSSHSAGLVGVDKGGFRPDLWHDVSADFLIYAFAKLPTDSPLKTVRRLCRRLLVTQAEIVSSPESAERITRARLAGLHRSGDLSTTRELSKLFPTLEEELTPKLKKEFSLHHKAMDKACELIQTELNEKGTPSSRRAFFVCQCVSEKKEAAEVAYNLLAESESEFVTSSFGQMGSALLGLAETSSPIVLSTLEDVMAYQALGAKAPLGPEMSKLRPDLYRILALDPALPALTRLAAAEQAFTMGFLKLQEWQAIVQALHQETVFTTSPSSIAKRLTLIKELPFPLTVENLKDSLDKVLALFQSAGKDGVLSSYVTLLQEPLQLSINETFVTPLVPWMCLGLWEQGEKQSAWLAKMPWSHMPIMLPLKFLKEPMTPIEAKTWMTHITSHAHTANLSVMIGALRGLKKGNAKLWSQVLEKMMSQNLEEPSETPVGWKTLLHKSLKTKKRGQSLLLTMLPFAGRAWPKRADVIENVLKSLERLGLKEEAHSLAEELIVNELQRSF